MNRIVVRHVPEVGERTAVDADGSHHLLRVQRLARGASVVATDASGVRATCTLVDVAQGIAILEVVAREAGPAPLPRVVLLGIPRGPALDEALTAGTEGGATEFRLFPAHRSPPGALRVDRMERVLRAAVTQCGRADQPVIRAARSLAEALDGLPALRYLAAPGATGPVGHVRDAAAVAIGPEGGWSPDEERALVDAGFIPIGLGPFILRTPTAVAAALGCLWPGSTDPA